MTYRTLGENIRAFSIAEGLTQIELGKKCGMADSQIGAYERGEVVPKEKNIRRIAEALGVSYEIITTVNEQRSRRTK